MENFKIGKPSKIPDNAFKLISADWFLITAGDRTHFNTMTASWGMLGHIWNLDVALCVIRPHRYTYEFVEKAEIFTMSFFDETQRDALRYCGKFSGRDVDKMKETGLIPIDTDLKSIAFEQAKLVPECKKLYADDLKPDNFLVQSLLGNYPKNDFHRFYIGEIKNCYTKAE